jgi:hypothetical protein
VGSLTISLALLFQSGCQQQAKTPDVPGEPVGRQTDETIAEVSQAMPKIEFDKTLHNFGEVGSGKKYTAEFRITNTGDGLLEITEVKPCCGVITELKKDEFEPGQSGVLTVNYNSGKSSGSVIRQIQVSSNDKSNPKITLTLKAKVARKVVHNPHRLQLVINKENAGCPDITLTGTDKQPFSIKSFQSTANSIRADVDPSVKSTKFILKPEVDFEKLQSRSAGFVSIHLTHPECDRVDIYFTMLRRFQITPASVMLFNPEPQKPTVKKVTVADSKESNCCQQLRRGF